ncbi:Dynein_light chain [Hexamita inflata]|uniref:Dynein light chain n=1 Tax=Hexamita inflata TaxID=28002 RepID=A0AA86QZN4_9EUKA|nr:Dynein light chain [Hexamita inflata]
MSSCIIIYITRSIFRNLKNRNIVHRLCRPRIKHSNVLNCSSFRNTDPSHHLNTVNMKEVQNILILYQTPFHTKSRRTKSCCPPLQFFFRKNMTDRQVTVKNADMPEEMQQDAIDCAIQAMERFNIEKDIAAYVKKEFDKKHHPTWHVIVGKNFGSYVTHETKRFIYFYIGQLAFLIFKSG